MHPKSRLFLFLIFAGLLFVSLGDNFLPHPLGDLSSNTRSKINHFLMGLFPDEKPINLYEKTDKVLEQAEQEEE